MDKKSTKEQIKDLEKNVKEGKIKISFFQDEDGKLDLRAIGAGIYVFELINRLDERRTLYVGQGGSMTSRGTDHLDGLFKDADYFRLEKDDLRDEELSLNIYVREVISDESERKVKEKEYINELKSLTQYEDSEVNNDRVLYGNVKVREEIRKFIDL